MTIVKKVLCSSLMACTLGTMFGCDVDIDRGPRTTYYDPYPYGHRYMYQRPVYVVPDYDRDRDHVRIDGRVDVR